MGYENVRFPSGTRILVTGSAGFIGSNLVEALLGKNVSVVGVDNFSAGLRKNAAEFSSNGGYRFIEGDICDFDTCLAASKGTDYVLHQAALGSVPRSMREPLLYVKNNVEGTANILEAARRNGVKRVVYASSSSVYGDSWTLPKQEDEIGNPLSPYALSKKTNEEYGKLYTNVYGMPCIGLRYFNVFGRRQNPDSPYAAIIPIMIKRLLIGQTVRIYGDGEQSRDFTYIDNVIEANLKACLASEAACGRVYNVAYGKRLTINELYEAVRMTLQADMEPEYETPRPGDIRHSLADISRAGEQLGYDPGWDFESGLAQAIEWYLESFEKKADL